MKLRNIIIPFFVLLFLISSVFAVVQSTSSILVENLFGNYLLLSLFGLLLVVGILMFIRTPKEVVMIIGGLLILGLVSSALFPKWILAIVIIFIGLFIGIFLLRMFFKHY
jgi:hypothetical protein